MSTIIPFKGLRYNQENAGPLEQLITPPYDIISKKEQQKYYQKNPYNCIRLELGEEYPEDTSINSRYTRSRNYLHSWIEKDILKADEKPSLYLYQQIFSAEEGTKSRTGLICGLKLEDYSKKIVLPHENTLPKDTADRYELMQLCHSNFSPIFGLYSDQEMVVNKLLKNIAQSSEPDVELTDENQVMQRLWVINDQESIDAIQKFMLDKQILIADGHHRYETALSFNKAMEAEGKTGFDYIMINLVNLYDSGLVIQPTHRMLKNIDIDVEHLLHKLKDYFILEIYDDKKKIFPSYVRNMSARKEVPVFGMTTQERIYVLTLDKWSDYEELLPKDKSEAWRNLDVTILQTIIFEKIMGLSADQIAKSPDIKYTHDLKTFFNAFKNKEFQYGFFMNATKMADVKAVAENGEKMPQKSTYFYPKVTTGFVFNYFDIQ